MRGPGASVARSSGPRRIAHLALWAAFAIACVVVVSGCSGIAEDTDTPGQAFYAAQQDYKALVSLAADYRDFCAAKAPHARGDCEDHVEEIRRIVNDIVQPAYKSALAAYIGSEGDTITFAANALSSALAQLQSYLLEHSLHEAFGQTAATFNQQRPPPRLQPILAKGVLAQ